MTLLNETFGITGTAQNYFGGEWWLVGILLLLIFVLYFYGRGISEDGVIALIFTSLLTMSIDNLFNMPETIYIPIILFILIYIGIQLYKVLVR